MIPDAAEVGTALAALGSTVATVNELAVKCRNAEVTMKFLEARDNLLDPPALEEPTENSLCRSSAGAGREWDRRLQFAIAAERLAV